MKISSDTDMYQTKTLRKLGQIGKHVQQRKPMMRHVVMRWLNFLFPSYIQVKYADSSKSRTRETYDGMTGSIRGNISEGEEHNYDEFNRKCRRSRSSQSGNLTKVPKPQGQLLPSKRAPLTINIGSK